MWLAKDFQEIQSIDSIEGENTREETNSLMKIVLASWRSYF